MKYSQLMHDPLGGVQRTIRHGYCYFFPDAAFFSGGFDSGL